MENMIYYNELYDLYESLLTDKERQTFIDYYQEDLSLSEIAVNRKVSRSAVSKNINNVLDKLKYYESHLHLYLKKEKLRKILSTNNLDDLKKELEKLYF